VASIEVREGRSGPSFRVTWRLEDGRQQSKSFRSRAEAKAFRSELEGARLRGVVPDLSAGSISLQAWSEEVLGMLFLKPKTLENYRSLLRSRILPTFGHRRLSTISRREIQAWVSAMALEVSAQRTRAAYGLLAQLLDEAVAHQRLLRNPARKVTLPRVMARDIRPLTREELFAVAEASGRYEPLILWLGLMGTRWAETVGLEWGQIRQDMVTIDSSLSEVNGQFHRVPTKTYAARRLPIPATVAQQLPERSRGLVFQTTFGNPIRGAKFRADVFVPACERAGIEPIRIHDLRHTCASLLVKGGANPKMVQQWMGHQDIRMTLNTYTHLYTSDLEVLARQLDAA
jgi:integrase